MRPPQSRCAHPHALAERADSAAHPRRYGIFVNAQTIRDVAVLHTVYSHLENSPVFAIEFRKAIADDFSGLALDQRIELTRGGICRLVAVLSFGRNFAPMAGALALFADYVCHHAVEPCEKLIEPPFRSF